jgi:hypothetical protein
VHVPDPEPQVVEAEIADVDFVGFELDVTELAHQQPDRRAGHPQAPQQQAHVAPAGADGGVATDQLRRGRLDHLPGDDGGGEPEELDRLLHELGERRRHDGPGRPRPHRIEEPVRAQPIAAAHELDATGSRPAESRWARLVAEPPAGRIGARR